MTIRFADGAFQLRGAKAQKRKREQEKREREERERGQEPLTERQAERLMALLAAARQTAARPTIERRMVRDGGLFGGLFERKLRDAAECLGVNVSSLNSDQKKLLVEMANQSLSDSQRRRMLADAE